MNWGFDELMKLAKGAGQSAAGAVGSWGGAFALKQAAGFLVPISMSKLGTVVAGAGTFHYAPTTLLQSFAMTPVGPPIIAGGAIVGGGYYLWKEYVK